LLAGVPDFVVAQPVRQYLDVARADTRRLDVIGVHQKVGGLFWKLLQNQEDPPKTFDSKPAPAA